MFQMGFQVLKENSDCMSALHGAQTFQGAESSPSASNVFTKSTLDTLTQTRQGDTSAYRSEAATREWKGGTRGRR